MSLQLKFSGKQPFLLTCHRVGSDEYHDRAPSGSLRYLAAAGRDEVAHNYNYRTHSKHVNNPLKLTIVV